MLRVEFGDYDDGQDHDRDAGAEFLPTGKAEGVGEVEWVLLWFQWVWA
jgi:hypothetical protein